MNIHPKTLHRMRIGFKSMSVFGGIVSLWLFYPPLSHQFYAYLTAHGFQDASFEETLRSFSRTMVYLLLMYATLKVVIKGPQLSWLISVTQGVSWFLTQLAAVGIIVAILYSFLVPVQQQMASIWMWLFIILFCELVSQAIAVWQRREEETRYFSMRYKD
ncbi:MULTISPECIES: hypothetical protein [Listeria]|uniref:hypothetical protein n=1 Tax=Listeria TaxID=1637 RepID=UPI000B589450|nr:MULTISPECIES: hypothetical protein [Listeria]